MDRKRKNYSPATSTEFIRQRIFWIRGLKVMLDHDLAALYNVPTHRLNEQVKRNLRRFPKDFMFQLTRKEFELLISQFAISRWGGRRTLPYAFTEQGIAMLSSVLHSQRAIDVNIQIMRVFIRLKEFMLSHKDFERKIEKLEEKFKDHDRKIIFIFDAIKQLLKENEETLKPKEPIGFRPSKM